MLSNSVQPPTVEHVYAQWQKRKEPSTVTARNLLQEDNGHSRDVKEEDSVSLTSSDLAIHNHFRSSRAVRLKGKAAGIQKLVSAGALSAFSLFSHMVRVQATKVGS